MRTITLPAKVCKSQHLKTAKCKTLPRCAKCGRVLAFKWGTLCFGCEQKAKATAAAKADPTTRRCLHCGNILQSVFTDDRTCTACAGVHNVKEAV